MRISPAVIMTIALAGFTACSGAYGPSGPGGGGGPVGSVSVGPGIVFVSRHNGSRNPAVDTIPTGATVTWTWNGSEPHSVRSIGSPSFASSGTLTGSGTYAVRFDVPGTYRYDCIVHGQAMTGTIVVTAAPPAEAADPVGDTFGGGGVQWDLTALTISRDTGGITVALSFSRDVLSPMSGDPTAMVGFVDFDVDRDSATGFTAAVDEFRHDGGSSGMGVDYDLQLINYAADSSVAVVDSLFQPIGHVKPLFSANRVTIRIPKALLGNDDGFLNAAALVGRTGGPTDFVPNRDHLRLTHAVSLS
jgi:plastocyanin